MASPRTQLSKAGKGRKQAHVLVIHGPNLNLLGTREPDIYGAETLAAIDRRLGSAAKGAGIKLSTFQSNSEGELVARVQNALKGG